MTKYLTRKQINEITGDVDFQHFKTMSTDSYNEEKLLRKFADLGRPAELIYCAINMAVVGYGNKRFGSFKYKDTVVLIAEVFRRFSVKSDSQKGAILEDDTLTPQRLCRLFRYQIQDYLKDTNESSYLYRKYSPAEEKYRTICFRGAEYLDDLKEDESAYLRGAVQQLDIQLGTKIIERIDRVFLAKAQLTLVK